MKNVVSVVMLAIAVLGCVLAGPVEARTGYPKIMNYYLTNTVDAEAIQILAKYDALALDADFELDNPGVLNQIRTINPDIVLLAYLPINGTTPNGWQLNPDRLVYKYWQGMDAGDFWLYSADGSYASDWPEKVTANLTPQCPTNPQGDVFYEWFAQFVYDEVWQQGNSNWDGVFLDDVWGSVSWLNSVIPSPIDSNRDGTPDDHAQLDADWQAVNNLCTVRIRDLLGPNALIMGNGSNPYFSALNGTMAENFPFNGPAEQGNVYNYAWTRWMFERDGAYLNGLANFNSSPQSLMTINASGAGTEAASDGSGNTERHKRLCLASALLGDGYFSFDLAWDDHKSLWWEPEYDYYLGAPLSSYYSIENNGVTVWRRDYEAGIVVVNPNNGFSEATADMPRINPWDAYIGLPPDQIDSTPPEAIGDLAAVGIDDSQLRLTWSAPADEGPSGRAASYVVRYSTQPISPGPTWVGADEVAQSLAPQAPGSPESLVLDGLTPSTTYYVAVRAKDASGNLGPMGPADDATTSPIGGTGRPTEKIDLVGDPFPNPTQGSTVHFNIETESGAEVEVEIYDVRGRRLGALPPQVLAPGEHELLWDSTAGAGLTGRGIYFLRVRMGNDVWTKKVHLLE